MKSDQKGKKTVALPPHHPQISILEKGSSMQVIDNKYLNQQSCVLISKHKPRKTTVFGPENTPF
jgi:hypothetical protein